MFSRQLSNTITERNNVTKAQHFNFATSSSQPETNIPISKLMVIQFSSIISF